jgi:hypothetical protein
VRLISGALDAVLVPHREHALDGAWLFAECLLYVDWLDERAQS